MCCGVPGRARCTAAKLARRTAASLPVRPAARRTQTRPPRLSDTTRSRGWSRFHAPRRTCGGGKTASDADVPRSAISTRLLAYQRRLRARCRFRRTRCDCHVLDVSRQASLDVRRVDRDARQARVVFMRHRRLIGFARSPPSAASRCRGTPVNRSCPAKGPSWRPGM